MNPIKLDLSIVDIERFTIRVPFREITARNMMRELPHWDVFEICRVTLHNGILGYGETMKLFGLLTPTRINPEFSGVSR